MTHLAIRLRQAFDFRYRAGLVLLALLASLTFLLTFRLTAMEESRAEYVSIAANQRALSQRIAFLANAHADAQSEAERTRLADSILRNVRTMERAHDVLTGVDRTERRAERFISPLRDIYFSGAMPFDLQVRDFLDDARSIATARDAVAMDAALVRVNAAGTNSLMQTHGLITRVMEHEATKAITAAERAELALWIVTLVLLVLEGVFVFRPMSRRIATSVDAVEKAEARSKELASAAEMASAARTRFFRSASHELRTPLNAILGITSVLKEQGKADTHDDELRQLEHAGEHLLHLIDNMLEMNRLGRDRIAIKVSSGNLKSDIEEICGLYADQRGGGKIGLETDIPVQADDLFLYDGDKLRQVIGNLLACLFAQKECGTIRVGVGIADDDGRAEVVFSLVHDRLTLAQLDLFDSGTAGHEVHRLDADTTFTLAIARNIIRRLGGQLAMLPCIEGGCEMRFTLTFDRPVQEETTGLDGRTILVVDDNIPNQMVASTFLKAEGASTVVANNGAEAVEMAAIHAFDLILMDISMPVMDGVEATRRIRATGGLNAETPIVALTAHVQQEEVDGLMQSGFTDILHKPIRKEVLVASILPCLAGRRAPVRKGAIA